MMELARKQVAIVEDMLNTAKLQLEATNETNRLLRLVLANQNDATQLAKDLLESAVNEVYSSTQSPIEEDCDCRICSTEKGSAGIALNPVKTPKAVAVAPKLSLLDIARRDLETLSSTPQLATRFGSQTIYEYLPATTPVKIEVNKNKRTVVALMKGENGKVVKTGIAKCAPDDEFIYEIGAAIAAYRLFDLEVPTAYLV